MKLLRQLMAIPVPWVFLLVYLAGAGLQLLAPVTPHSAELRQCSQIAGGVLMVAGGTLAAWCLLLFRRARTTTTPGETSAALVTAGPYRFSRNPMYVSLTLFYLGEAGLLVQLWPVILLPLVLAYLRWVVIPVEEERLAEAFGTVYREYRASVRRWV